MAKKVLIVSPRTGDSVWGPFFSAYGTIDEGCEEAITEPLAGILIVHRKLHKPKIIYGKLMIYVPQGLWQMNFEVGKVKGIGELVVWLPYRGGEPTADRSKIQVNGPPFGHYALNILNPPAGTTVARPFSVSGSCNNQIKSCTCAGYAGSLVSKGPPSWQANFDTNTPTGTMEQVVVNEAAASYPQYNTVT